jgi:hypothetical protein
MKKKKIYLHVAACNILFPISHALNILTIMTVYSRMGRVIRGRPPINCRWVQGTGRTVGKSIQGIARKAIVEFLVHPGTLREDPCQGLEQGHLR